MGRIGPLQTTFTARGLPRYRLEVWHDELNRYSMLRGDDPSALVSQAQARVAQWDATWTRRAAIAAYKHLHHQQRALALAQTQEATDILAELENTLRRALEHNPAFDWEALRDRRPFPEARPVEAVAPQEPPRPSLPPEPQRDDPIFQPARRVLDLLLPSRREKYRRRKEKLFGDAHEEWRKEVGRLKSLHAKMREQHEELVCQTKHSFELSFDDWQNRRAAFLQTQLAQHSAIDGIRERFQTGAPGYIVEILQRVLKRSHYPDWMPRDLELVSRLVNSHAIEPVVLA